MIETLVADRRPAPGSAAGAPDLVGQLASQPDWGHFDVVVAAAAAAARVLLSCLMKLVAEVAVELSQMVQTVDLQIVDSRAWPEIDLSGTRN